MIFSLRIYRTILFHISLILLTAGAGIWLLLSGRGYILGSLLMIGAFFQIGALVHRLNTFNRKIRLFFDAIEGDENTLHFPELSWDREQALLNHSLNRINELLAQTKTEFRKQEHFYRSLLEEVPSGVLAWDSQGKIIIANTAALALLECVTLTHYSQLEPLLHSPRNRKRLSISQNRMKLEGETVTLLSVKDIGDELSDQESESWSNLSHVLTHEIMNTIAPIISLSQTLSHYPDLPEKAVHGLDIIQAQSERLMEFTESFRHLSYLPPPEKKPFSLTQLLHNLETLLQTDFEDNGIVFTLLCEPASIEMKGDKNQLSQVLLNLLKNAMQALEDKTDGNITLTATQTDRLCLTITDNGPGIPAELQEKIFIPFFTTKSEGSGIGLSLCKQIIRRHDGHLSLAGSRAGCTTFRIDLPLTTI